MDRATTRLLWAGVAAAVWYTAVVLIGALATPGYSHIGEHVSTLYQSGSPNGIWIAALFAVYNLLILAFGVGAAQGGLRAHVGRSTPGGKNGRPIGPRCMDTQPGRCQAVALCQPRRGARRVHRI